MKRLVLGLVLVVIGIFCFSFGWARLVTDERVVPMSDEAVIERAEELGMVDLKDALTPEEVVSEEE
jgi:hypothetical protein